VRVVVLVVVDVDRAMEQQVGTSSPPMEHGNTWHCMGFGVNVHYNSLIISLVVIVPYDELRVQNFFGITVGLKISPNDGITWTMK
jgi:hypothetical protein